jgi:hypothetical protein
MISLCTNMHGYYAQADGVPQYINMLEDAQKRRSGRDAHRRRRARDDGLGGCSCGATLSPRSRRLGGLTLGLSHVAGMEKGLPPCPPETPAADFGFGGGRASRRCSWGATGGGAGDRTVREGTRQPSLAATNDTVVLQQLTAPIWLSRPPLACSPQPTRHWRPRWHVAGERQRRGHQRVHRGDGQNQRRSLTLGTIAGCMVIASASPTPVPPAPTRGPAIAMTPRQPTPTEVAQRTKVGTRRAPDRGGWRL